MQGVFPHSAQCLDPFHVASLSKQARDDSEKVNPSQIASVLVAHTATGTDKQAKRC